MMYAAIACSKGQNLCIPYPCTAGDTYVENYTDACVWNLSLPLFLWCGGQCCLRPQHCCVLRYKLSMCTTLRLAILFIHTQQTTTDGRSQIVRYIGVWGLKYNHYFMAFFFFCELFFLLSIVLCPRSPPDEPDTVVGVNDTLPIDAGHGGGQFCRTVKGSLSEKSF